jgi:hypothetical protein
LYQRGSADLEVVIDVSPHVAGCHVVPHDVAFHHGCRDPDLSVRKAADRHKRPVVGYYGRGITEINKISK